jgi:hypothetical protein
VSLKSRYGKEEKMSKFTPLTAWLKRQSQNSVLLTFEQIDKIIAPNALPNSARQYFSFWAKYGEGAGISKAYSDAGFKIVMIDLENEEVRLRRKTRS